MQEIQHPCKPTSHISCKTCSHHHNDIGKLQFTDIPAKFHNCYGTDTVPLSTQYFIAAFSFHPWGVQQTWPTPGSSRTVTHSSRPKHVPPTHSIAEAVRSTAADATFSRPLPNQPADDDTEMTRPTIEGEITCSSELKPLWIVSSLWIIPPSLSMRNTTLLSPSFLSLIPGPLSPLTSVLTSRSWNAIWWHTCSLAVAVSSQSMFQPTPFLIHGSNFCLKLSCTAFLTCTMLYTLSHHSWPSSITSFLACPS